MQTTIAKKASIKGIGLHSGLVTTLTVHPAPVDSGITFWRSDLIDNEKCLLNSDRIRETQLCTGILLKKEMLMTIEHLLSSMYCEKIDNLVIEVKGSELPIFDGSAAAYQILWQEAGRLTQDKPRRILEIIKPIKVEENQNGGYKSAQLIPADHFKVKFEVDNFQHPFISRLPNKIEFDFETDNYWQEIARARTFGFLRDVVFMQERGLGLGGGLANALVFDHEKVLNEEGMRFPDEIVRHKILDAIGDIYTLGVQIKGEYIGYRSGHAINNQLIRDLDNKPDHWHWLEESNK